ncbi:MAG: hypothetical protein D6681_06765 [Calditrichaeota bacterium]|nr:MAG: hypothetical protein D6681_06765 [Calditrichota bacterium]
MNSIRDQVILFLILLTSERCQALLHPFLSPERTAYELLRLWFDDIYAPGTRYMETLKGDFSEAAVARFEEAFDVEELVSLERFHHFLELRLEMLPEQERRKRVFPLTDSWRHIQKDARYLLQELEPNLNQRRRELEEKLARFVRGAPALDTSDQLFTRMLNRGKTGSP